MTADELKAAATRLRALAEAATPGPWRESSVDGLNRYAALVSDVQPEGRLHGGGWGWDDSYGGYLIAESLQPQDRAYIAAMNPLVALALADWLDDVARPVYCASPGEGRSALAVARAINGGAS